MDGGVWWATVHGVGRSRTRLSDFTFTFHFHALEKEMAAHSSVLAWRIPGMTEPCGLLSMGLHRVGHDWSDLAAAAAYCHLSSGFADWVCRVHILIYISECDCNVNLLTLSINSLRIGIIFLFAFFFSQKLCPEISLYVYIPTMFYEWIKQDYLQTSLYFLLCEQCDIVYKWVFKRIITLCITLLLKTTF